MVLLMAVSNLAACTGPSAPPPTRLVGAHRVALSVPAHWRTDVEHGSYCPATKPDTVELFAPAHGPVGSCAVPVRASWPAVDSVSIYTTSSGGVETPRIAPSGTLHGMPYYVTDSRQPGPGVALTLTVPRAGVAFLVGSASRDAATSLLATVRLAPPGHTCASPIDTTGCSQPGPQMGESRRWISSAEDHGRRGILR